MDFMENHDVVYVKVGNRPWDVLILANIKSTHVFHEATSFIFKDGSMLLVGRKIQDVRIPVVPVDLILPVVASIRHTLESGHISVEFITVDDIGNSNNTYLPHIMHELDKLNKKENKL